MSARLPEIQLEVSGTVFSARGKWLGIQWSVHAEAEKPEHARTVVKTEDCIVADVTVHAADHVLASEVQDIACALVWSRLRAIAFKRGWGTLDS